MEKTSFYRNFTFSYNERERSVDFFIFNSEFDLPSVGESPYTPGLTSFSPPRQKHGRLGSLLPKLPHRRTGAGAFLPGPG